MGNEDDDEPEKMEIQLSSEEVKYRQKYLPEPTTLPDDKLVCTVCSVSLAQDIHQREVMFVHRVLRVLVCETCYGDGSVPADKDGNNQICRWCGRDGTLIPCSSCTCAFCKKCLENNLKSSALASVKNDDWKCLICIPRPIFGHRTICWAAQEMISLGKGKNQLELKVQAHNIAPYIKRDQPVSLLQQNHQASSSSDGAAVAVKPVAETLYNLNVKDNDILRKRKYESDDSYSSSDCTKSKKSRFDDKNSITSSGRLALQEGCNTETHTQNGLSDIEKKQNKQQETNIVGDSSTIFQEENNQSNIFPSPKKVTDDHFERHSQFTIDMSQPQFNEPSEKKQSIDSCSFDSLQVENNTQNKRKHQSTNNKLVNDDKKLKSNSVVSSQKSPKKDELIENKITLIDDKELCKSIPIEVLNKKLATEKSISLNDLAETDQLNFNKNKSSENLSTLLEEVNLCSESKNDGNLGFDTLLADNGTILNIDNTSNIVTEAMPAVGDIDDQQNTLTELNNNPYLKEVPDVESNSENINSSIESLNSTVNDLSGLGRLISIRANQFRESKLKVENLNSYSDVLAIADSIKQLLNNIHMNYRMVEYSLEDQLKAQEIFSGTKILENLTPLLELDIRENEPEDVCGRKNDQNPTKPETELLNDEISSKLAINNEPANQLLTCASDIESEFNIKVEKESSEKMFNDFDNVPENIHLSVVADFGSLDVNNQSTDKNISNDINIVRKKWIGLLTDESSSDNETDMQENHNLFEDDNSSTHMNSKILLNFKESTIVDKLDQTSETKGNKSAGETCHENYEDGSDIEKEVSSKKDSQRNEALQSMLCTSSEDEMVTSLSDSSSDESDEILLDDSDLDLGKKPRKTLTKTFSGSKKRKKESSNKIEEGEVCENSTKEETKKIVEELDSEAEIDMLTDMTKLKKKTFSRRLLSRETQDEDSEEESDEIESDNDESLNIKKAKTYNSEIKKRREEERNELFRFLDSNSSSEDEIDISKKDLDVIEDQLESSSESMTFEDFSQKMIARMQEQQKEQEEMNLKILLASDSDEGSTGGDDIILEDGSKKKKKASNKKTKEKEENSTKNEEDDIKMQQEESIKDEEELKSEIIKPEPDDKYEQFLKGFTKTKFKGLGSSSEETDHENNIEIKEEVVDNELEIKKDPNESDVNNESSSDTSGDIFKDKSKTKSMKKKSWRSDKLLHIKVSDTDTSDEERFWQRRLQKEQKKKEELGDSDSSGYDAFAEGLPSAKPFGKTTKKEDNSSDKENKKEMKKEKDIDQDDSSTLDLSSTESSGSVIIRKKKKKKNEKSDSDVISISEDDKKRKKKKKVRNLSSDSSNESNESGDDIINISQKSTQGESPGKGGRKNIRKVLTKHELAAATKAAAKEEEERKKRIAARQKLFNEMFEIKEAEVLQKLVLDFDPETKTELISVDHDLVTKMKPHQAKGVKFMWDSCFESLSQLKTKKGSGCILAHCMGLGKTFQVISLVHTILKHKDTNVKTVLVVCPLSTVLNWYSEFDKWLDDVAGGRDIKVFHLTKHKRDFERSRQLSLWQEMGGVMIMGYELFRILTNPTSKKYRLKLKAIFQKTLVDPGADLVVCDEGHMLKNESTVLSKAMSRIKTLRRIVLTGTPMQNNLKEYHCMVQFVKPNLLGTRKEFLNQFVNPITNGQFVDSTESDVKVMKRRAHVLHKMLEGLVQRFDYSVLTPFLPPKHEYVISLRLTEVQVRLYQFYLDNFSQTSNNTRTGSQLFMDWQALGRIWTHPRVLKMSTDKAEKEKEKQRLEESEDEVSIKDFIDDKSSSLSLSGTSSSSDEKKESKQKEIQITTKETPSTLPTIEAEINLISSDEDEIKIYECESNPIKTQKEEELQNEQEVNKEGSEKKHNVDISDVEKKETEFKVEEKAEYKNLNPIEKNEEESQDNNEDVQIKEKEKTEDKEEEEEEKEKDVCIVKEENLDKQDKEVKTEETIKTSSVKYVDSRSAWWRDIIEPEHLDDINQSAKLTLLLAILKECEMIEDKVLVFSQSLFSLDLIEYFLEKIDKATEENRLDQNLGNHTGCWTRGLDYFRLDGSSSSENRSAWCKTFNREDNPRARLFLISTRAGGLGINLTGANRVVIFDASWNPSHDVQSIFRIYRFGQKKPCYVYRFIAHGTMEEKVYDRQVAKQSLSSRVVDEQQVHRHFSMNDLNELYRFTPPVREGDRPTPVLPKDRLMAEILTQYNELIEKYHEHDSLLENIVEEELNEEERKLAWEDFENDKRKIDFPGSGVSSISGINLNNQQEFFRRSLRLKYPNSSEAEMNAMLQTLMFQVNSVANQKSQQFSTVGQQPQQSTSTSQISGPQTFQTIPTSKLGPGQMFNLQRGQVANSFGQNAQSQMGQRMGNMQIKQNQKQQIMRANYMNQMRIQQQVNLNRVLNQNKQQSQVSNVYQPASKNMQILQKGQPQHAQNIQGQLFRNRQQPAQNRQQQYPVQNNRQVTINRQPNGQQQPALNRGPIPNVQSLMKTGAPTITRMMKSTQQLTSNQSQPPRAHQQAARAKSLNRPQLQGIPVSGKTQQQLQQEKMKQRISMLQKQKQLTLQQKLKEKTETNRTSTSFIQKKKLEEMKNRYTATRKNISTDINVVEIEDEPSQPSGSST